MIAYFQLCLANALASSLSLLIQTGAWGRHIHPLRRAWRLAVFHLTSHHQHPCQAIAATSLGLSQSQFLFFYLSAPSLPAAPIHSPLHGLCPLRTWVLSFSSLFCYCPLLSIPVPHCLSEFLWLSKGFTTPGSWHLLLFHLKYSFPGLSTPCLLAMMPFQWGVLGSRG